MRKLRFPLRKVCFVSRAKRLFVAILAMVLLSHPWAEPLADPPKRVASLIPSHTEILATLRCENSLVGLSDVEDPSVYPNLPRVGGLQPNWEALISLKPDIVLADVSHQRYQKEFDRFRLPVLFLPTTQAENFDDVFQIVRRLGQLMGRSELAEELVRGYQARLKTIESRIPKTAAAPRVYFEIWPRPLQACGPKSLQGYLLTRAGAENILPVSRNTVPRISLEWVPQRSPDVIIHTGVVSTEEISRRPGWDHVPAVESGRVYRVDRDKFSRAGPRILDAFDELVDLLYGSGRK